MSQPDRRTFLGALGAGSLGAFAGSTAARPAGHPTSMPTADLDALAELVRTTPREGLLAKAVELHRQGTHWRDLLGAAFLAGIRDVEPRPVGFAFHCVLMTSSGFQIAEASPEEDRLLVALYNLDDMKMSQARDAGSGDWRLPAPKAAGDLDGRKAIADFTAALDAWDQEAADRAATAVARSASLDQAFAPLWSRGARDFTNIGHKPIFVAQAYRTLQQIGWRHGEDVLRSLAWGLLDGRPGQEDGDFEPNRERAARLGGVAAGGKASVAASFDLLAALREADVGPAADAVVTAMKDGVALSSIRDGLRLWAVELLMRMPGIVGVHPLTACNALFYSAQQSRDAGTERLCLLQAASWLARYRTFFAERRGYYGSVHIDGFEPAAGPSDMNAVMRVVSDKGWREATPLALRAVTDAGPGPYATATRHWLVRKVREHHDYKYLAALLEEAELAAPAVGARLLAGGISWLRGPQGPDHPLVLATG